MIIPLILFYLRLAYYDSEIVIGRISHLLSIVICDIKNLKYNLYVFYSSYY